MGCVGDLKNPSGNNIAYYTVVVYLLETLDVFLAYFPVSFAYNQAEICWNHNFEI